MKRLAQSLAWLSAILFATPALAQAPIQFVNSPEAVRLYEERMMEQLREHCTPQKSNGLFDRAEVKSIRHGYTSANVYVNDPNRYSIYLYDGDKHNFLLIDGQRLSRESRLTIPLALPRDYSYCRIVRDVKGFEQLEVLHKVQTATSESQAFDKLLRDAADFATMPLPATCQSSISLPFTDKLMLNGKETRFSLCQDATVSLRERMTKLVRRVHD